MNTTTEEVVRSLAHAVVEAAGLCLIWFALDWRHMLAAVGFLTVQASLTRGRGE